MSYADLVQDHLPHDVITAGRALFERGQVDWVRRDSYEISAAVRDGKRYTVQIDLDLGDIVGLYCTCEAGREVYEDDPPCRHAYAALLAADHKFGARGGGKKKATPQKPPEPSWQRQFNAIQGAVLQPRWGYDESDYNGGGGGKVKGSLLYIIDAQHCEQQGNLSLQAATQDVKANGELGKVKTRQWSNVKPSALADPNDRALAAMVAGCISSSYYWDHAPIPRKMWDIVLPAIANAGKLFYRQVYDGPLTPLKWDGGSAWQLYLNTKRNGELYEVTGELRRDGEALPASQLKLAINGLLIADDTLCRVDTSAAAWVLALRRQPVLNVPINEVDQLLAQLVQLPTLPRLDFPEELKIEQVELAPEPHLTVRKPKTAEYPFDKLRGYLSFRYDGVAVSTPLDKPIYDAKRRRLIRRDPATEQKLAERLAGAGFKPQASYYQNDGAYLLAPSKLPAAVRTLVAEGWKVEADGKLFRQAGQVDVNVASGIDWFELHGSVSFGDQTVALPALLAALRRGDSTVALGDGTMGMLPEAWLKKYGLVAGAGTVDGDVLRFTKTQAGLLDALLAAEPQASCDAVFEQTRRALRTFEGVESMDPPASFTGSLRPYQREALGWFAFLERFGFGGVLADDMGLGKTVQVLALLESRRVGRSSRKDERRPSLVVVPRSLIFNWKAESAKFAPGLRVLDNSVVNRVKTAEGLKDHDLVLTTYGTLLRDAASLKDVHFDYVILDEAQAVKNASSESAKAARLLKARHRLCLSGTPVQNHLGELWSLFEFLNPGMLGGATVFSAAASKAPDEESRKLLARALRPFILRRTKEQVARDLPAKQEQTIYCELEGEQKKLYAELRDHYRASLLGKIDEVGLGKSKILVLEALLRLRQAALHPGLLDKEKAKDPSAKLDVLLPRIMEVLAEGHKALVFSQFTGMLSILKKRLDAAKVKYEYLDGKTKDRQARVDRFQQDDGCRLFLISLKAGGLGLNLTQADYVFLLDPWWNPAVEAQAIDRAHRIGQTKQVFACRLIAKDTVEEKVLALQEKKKALADAIIGEDNSMLKSLGREELELLLS